MTEILVAALSPIMKLIPHIPENRLSSLISEMMARQVFLSGNFEGSRLRSYLELYCGEMCRKACREERSGSNRKNV